MAKVGTFECASVEFDIYNTERIPVGLSQSKYFITPNKLKLVRQWLSINNIDIVTTKEQMNDLIELGLLERYD